MTLKTTYLGSALSALFLTAALIPAGAYAQTFTTVYSGQLTPNNNGWVRPAFSGNNPPTQTVRERLGPIFSLPFQPNRLTVQPFYVAADGTYTAQTISSTFFTFLVPYSDRFNANNPVRNALSTATLGTTASVKLAIDTQYFLVTTSLFRSSNFLGTGLGEFTNQISGPGEIFLGDLPDPIPVIDLIDLIALLSPAFLAELERLLAVDEANFSANFSGLSTVGAQRQILTGVVNTGLRDVGGRLFNLRSRTTQGDMIAAVQRGEKYASANTVAQLGNMLYSGVNAYDGKMLSTDWEHTYDDKKMMEDVAPLKRWNTYAQGDFNWTQTDASNTVTGYEGDTQVVTLGGEYNFTRDLAVGLAGSYVMNQTDYDNSIADVDLEGWNVIAYGNWFYENFWVDALYSFGLQRQDISRNTGLGGNVGRATAGVDSYTHTGQLNFGYNIPVGSFVTGPTANIQYLNGTIDSYTESGGGFGNMSVPEQNFDSLITRVGWQASYNYVAPWGMIVPQGRLSWDHESLADASNFTVNFANVPAFSASGTTAAPGRDWMGAGAGVRVYVGDQWSLLVDYSAEVFRQASVSHYLSANASFSF